MPLSCASISHPIALEGGGVTYHVRTLSGKEEKIFDRPCILETALHADFAIIKAQKGDTYGNLWFKEI